MTSGASECSYVYGPGLMQAAQVVIDNRVAVLITGHCRRVCAYGAVDMLDAERGEWFVSNTRHGLLVHARQALVSCWWTDRPASGARSSRPSRLRTTCSAWPRR